MKPLSTFSLFAVAAVLFGYIMIFERDTSRAANEGSDAPRVFSNLDPGKVTRVEIVCTNYTLGAERADEEWRLINPAYPAQGTSIERLVETIAELRRLAEISPHEYGSHSNGLASFGLSPPRASVIIDEGTNRHRVKIGNKTLLGEQLYIQIGSARGIEVVEAAILEQLPASRDQWRNPMLIPLDHRSFDRLIVTNNARVLEIQRDRTEASWRLAKPLPTRADPQAVQLLFQHLRSARVTQFVTDDARTDGEPFGLQTPELELTLTQRTNVVFQAQFGKPSSNDAGQVYVRLLGSGNVVLAPRETLDLLREPHEKYRARTLVNFAADKVNRIDVSAAQQFALQLGTNNLWQITEPFQATADRELVREFLSRLAGIEIARFEKDGVTDFSGYGLVPPARQCVLRTTSTNSAGMTNEVLAQIDFSTNLVDLVFARRADESSVYAVPYGDVLGLPSAAFLMRDRQIWSFPEKRVASVRAWKQQKSRNLVRDQTGRWSADLIANAALDEALHRLGDLKATSWVGKGDDQLRLLGFHSVDFGIDVEAITEEGPRHFIVRFGILSGSGEPYASTVLEENQPVIFRFPKVLFKELVDLLSPTILTVGR